MNLSNFFSLAITPNMKELDKIELLLFYSQKQERALELDIPTLSNKLLDLGYSKPNISRLKNNLNKSRRILRGQTSNYYRLHKRAFDDLNSKYAFLNENSELIHSTNSILPEDLYMNIRGFISKLAIQINCSYDNKIADACAVLMRRLIEILLILSYRAKNKESEIKDPNSDQYKNLTSIINYTVSNKILSIQRETVEVLHDFRELGNFSAHGIQYNCRIEEINNIKRSYRFAVEDLMYAAQLKS